MDKECVPPDEPSLDAGHVGSVAELGNSFEMVRIMSLVPIEISDLAMITALPTLSLVATVVPLNVVATHVLQLLV